MMRDSNIVWVGFAFGVTVIDTIVNRALAGVRAKQRVQTAYSFGVSIRFAKK